LFEIVLDISVFYYILARRRKGINSGDLSCAHLQLIGKEYMESVLEAGGILILLWVIIFEVIKIMAENDFGFTFGLENHIKFIEKGGQKTEKGWRGGTFYRMIANVPGYILDENNQLVESTFTPPEPLSHQLFGVYWTGLPFLYHVKTFKVKKEKENVKGTGPEDWVLGQKDAPVDVDALRARFPRPFIFTDVELADRLKVHLKLVAKIRVVFPYIPVYHYTDDFFTQIASILQGYVIDKLAEKGMTIDDFLSLPKGGGSRFLKEFEKEDSELNLELTKQVGVVVESLAVNDWEPGDKDIIKAIQQKGLNKATGEAEVELAVQRAKARITTAEAEAKAQNLLTDARAKRIRETVAALKSEGGDATVVAQCAARVLEKEAVASESSKITTLVEGDRQIAIPVGGSK
jgi:hypothetical protein